MSLRELLEENIEEIQQPTDEILLEFFGKDVAEKLFDKGDARKQADLIIVKLQRANRLADRAIDRKGYIYDEDLAFDSFDLIDEVYNDIDRLIDTLDKGEINGKFRKSFRDKELKKVNRLLQKPLDKLIAAVDKS